MTHHPEATGARAAHDSAALGKRLEAAKVAATQAGAALLKHYGRRDRLVIDQKGVNDFVSQADREAEDIIASVLRPAFPDDAFMGEETGLSGPSDAGMIWCVDPLDGTSNFLKGAHNWCVSIGLWSGGEAVLGVILDPLRQEMFEAVKGQGARLNGQAISVSNIASLDQSAIGVGHNRRLPVDDVTAGINALLHRGAGFRQVGAGALMLAYTAAGRVDAYVEAHMWAWDAVAGLCLIREAGGVLGEYLPDNHTLADGGPVLVSNPALYPRMVEALGETHPLTRRS